MVALLPESHCALTSMFVDGKEMTDTSAQAIASVLSLPDCKLNKITEETGRVMVSALKSPHCNLTTLGIPFQNSNVSDEVAQAIAFALGSPHCKLTSLSLK